MRGSPESCCPARMPSDDRRTRRHAHSKADASATRSVRLQLQRLARLLPTVALGVAAGWLCTRIGLPLAWMVGPLVVTAGRAVWLGAPHIPVWLRWGGQMVVASAVAHNLTRETLAAVVSHFWLMLLSAGLIIVASFALAALVRRASGIDRATALFASLPGGPMEMAALTQQAGGSGALVAFAQTLRIAAIVVVIPPLLILFGAHFVAQTSPPVGSDLPGLALILAVGLLSALALRLLGGSNAFFLGPLIGVGALTMADVPLGQIPMPVIAMAQVALGLSLGGMFDRSLVLSARSFILFAALISAILIALALGLAVAYSAAGYGSFALYALANAPGSITEMAVAAKGLELDASLVTAFHVLRILIIIPLAALLFRGFVRLADWVDAVRSRARR